MVNECQRAIGEIFLYGTPAAEVCGDLDARVPLPASRDETLLLRRVLDDFARQAMARALEPERPDASLALQALRLVHVEHTKPDVSLRAVAARLHVPPWHVSRILSQRAGGGFRSLLRTARLKHAELLLKRGSGSVKEVAYAVGYRHVSDFCHHFKQRYRLSPTAYRRTMRFGKL